MRTTSLMLTLLAAACTPPAPPSPSILLVTLDTTRADHIGAYGYVLADTPAEDRLAAEGTLFSRAYSTCPLTIPSHSTILTGRVPPSHGVRDNGDFILGDDNILIPERLKEFGYTTAAFTAAFPTQARWGFDQGFDYYHDPLKRLPTQLDWSDQRRANEVVDDALDTLATIDKDEPLFVWVHMFDAHWPYDPPEPFASEHLGRPYDGEIAFASSELGRLVDAWDKRMDGRPNVVLVTGDHGEGLGDGGEQTHGFLLHDGTIHVPLIARGTGFDAGVVVDDPVSHIDIAPTLLRIAGVPIPAAVQGLDLRDGGSELAYSEALTGQFNLGLSPLYAFTEHDGRYMEGAWGGWYDAHGTHILTVNDRDADTSEAAARLAAYRGELDEVIAPTATLGEEDLELLQAMGYFGGDVTAEAGDVDPRDVIDIIPLTWQARQAMGAHQFRRASMLLTRLDDRMPGTFGVDLLRAQLQRAQGRDDLAAEAFADLYLRAPSSTVALQLASIQASRGMWAEAEGWYREALELQPHSPEAMAGLVRSVRQQGDDALAQELADEYLLIFPDHAELGLIRAEMYLTDNRAEDALAEAQWALEEMPNSPWAHAVTSQALWELGEADPAITLLQDALRTDPYNTSVRLRLAECLTEVGRHAEATRALAPLARLFPDNEDIQSRYAESLAALEAERRR